MPLVPKIVSFWRTLARGRKLDVELDAELRSYGEELTARNIAKGAQPG